MIGFSQFLSLILIFVILVSLTSFLVLYFTGYFNTITSAYNSNVGDVISSCMKIESAKNNKIYLKNCGSGVIKKDKLNIMIDNDLFNFSMNKDNVEKSEIAEITIKDSWKLSLGNHKIAIFSPGGKVERYVKASLPDSAVLILDFDEGSGNYTYDKSPYGNNGTLYSGASICSNPPILGCPKWTQGKSGSALEFDGSNDFVSVSHDKSINITGGYTIELWVKRNVKTGYQYFVQKEENCNGYGIAIDDSLRAFIYFGNGTDCGGFWLRTTSSYTPSTDQFYHLMGTHTSGEQKIYVNGNQVSIVSGGNYVGNPLSTSTPLNIGRHATSGFYFNGTIDSVRIYNKALTPDGIISFTLGELT